jgi:hypothetical protein
MASIDRLGAQKKLALLVAAACSCMRPAAKKVVSAYLAARKSLF